MQCFSFEQCTVELGGAQATKNKGFSPENGMEKSAVGAQAGAMPGSWRGRFEQWRSSQKQ
jgi:hypothetical protein